MLYILLFDPWEESLDRSNIHASLVRICFRDATTYLGHTRHATMVFVTGKYRKSPGVPFGRKPLGQHESPHRGASLQRPWNHSDEAKRQLVHQGRVPILQLHHNKCLCWFWWGEIRFICNKDADHAARRSLNLESCVSGVWVGGTILSDE